MPKTAYKSPIRVKRKVLFVYATPKNHRWLTTHLEVLSASEFVNRLLTFMREDHPDFHNILFAVEGRRQTKGFLQFNTPLNPEVKDAG